jgi:predicted RNA binding protein YcfA (HicA-like mRNA interferase family)
MRKYLLHAWRLPLGKLRILSDQAVCRILTKHGFIEIRRKGSHIVMQKQTNL